MPIAPDVADKISRYLRQDDGKRFWEVIQNRRWQVSNALKNNSELIEVGRSQGRLDILDWLLSLKEN